MTQPIQLIVGLGNPGPEYTYTRHNAGAWYVAALANRYNGSLREDPKYFGLCGRIQINGHDVRLLIPTTFMNLSGKSVVALAKFFQIPPEAILVAHDELDLPPGVAKFKQGGGHGGHNGLKDIINKLGNNNQFHRLRLGIGHPGTKEQVVGFVLTKAPKAEQQLIDDALDEAVRATDILFTNDMTKAMNRLHSFKATA
ncbi:MAG: aminoacyl-tRNA hydrolase [Tolumonas sp.]|nr:aminoacyl-tRNA hydrolase [uncultured Tolumonas sp.]MDD2842690.1 aminoacyl-tRNA hydrolase [Tolumonas sp.]